LSPKKLTLWGENSLSGGKGAERLDGGDRARPDIFAMEKLLKAFEDALIGGLREKGKQGPLQSKMTP
jgi:hypothetical protein